MDKPTHTTKTIMVNGRVKTIYVRTEETVMEIDNYRMGFFARYQPLNLGVFGDKLKAQQLIISAPYAEAKRVIRTRLGLDRRPHKVLTGTTLLQYYFSPSDYREGFPVFKQLYLLFGYSESTNRRLHEVVNETFFTRDHHDSHIWLIMPNNLETMAAQWGDALLNLKTFPQLLIPEQEREEGSVSGPVSSANPVDSQAVGGPVPSSTYRHASYPQVPDEFDADAAPPPVAGDPNEERRKKRDRDKWSR
jgi:hypothetical protein